MSTKPNLRRQIANEIVRGKGVPSTKVAVLAIRGYFEDAMGKPDENDRGMYDDALFVLGPGGEYGAYNGNTDPSAKWKHRLAQLMPGVWQYQEGDHNLRFAPTNPRRYPAFRQAAEVTVRRDGVGPLDTGYFGINIHRGGSESTSSEGCQTVPPDQWIDFRDLIKSLLRKHGQRVFPYVLIENEEHERAVNLATKPSDWEVCLPDGSVFPASKKEPGGRPSAPIRALAQQLGGEVDWDGNPSVNGKQLKWYWLDGNVAWGLVREIAEACGKRVSVAGKKVTISA